MSVIVEVACGESILVVERVGGVQGATDKDWIVHPKYSVIVDGVVKHPNCKAEDVMHALGHYIHSLSHQLSRVQEKPDQN